MENKCCGKFVNGHLDDKRCQLAQAIETIKVLKDQAEINSYVTKCYSDRASIYDNDWHEGFLKGLVGK